MYTVVLIIFVVVNQSYFLGTLPSIDSVLYLLSVQHSYLQASFILFARKNVANDLSKSIHMYKLTIKRCKLLFRPDLVDFVARAHPGQIFTKIGKSSIRSSKYISRPLVLHPLVLHAHLAKVLNGKIIECHFWLPSDCTQVCKVCCSGPPSLPKVR